MQYKYKKLALSLFYVLPDQISCLFVDGLTAGKLTDQQKNADCLPGWFLCKFPCHLCIGLS